MLQKILVALALAGVVGLSGSPASAQTGDFPDIVGIWTGVYEAAFAKSHSTYPDRSGTMEMELDVYQQEANLVWAHNRWRPAGAESWHVEEATGTFKLESPKEIVFTERAPIPVDWASNGFFTGSVVDGTLFLTYHGLGNGISFAVALERRAE